MARRRRSWKRIVLWVVVGLVALFGLIQLVPYGRNHTNPVAKNPFKWVDAEAEAIAKRSCYDCHSYETKWWWATNIAPFSWLVQHDVDSGRQRLNFSNWAGNPADEIRHAVNDGMPPIQYKLIHWSAGLSAAQKQTLINGYKASVGSNSAGAPALRSAAVPILNSQCSRCHPAPVDYRASSASQAGALITDMVNKGATVSASQRQALVKYFTQ